MEVPQSTRVVGGSARVQPGGASATAQPRQGGPHPIRVAIYDSPTIYNGGEVYE
jgi:hypothetical protein